MDKAAALKIVYDMVEQTLDRDSYSYEDWPEAWDALATLQPEVYPDGDKFVTDKIEGGKGG